jgi:hypothetical protein
VQGPEFKLQFCKKKGRKKGRKGGREGGRKEGRKDYTFLPSLQMNVCL